MPATTTPPGNLRKHRPETRRRSVSRMHSKSSRRYSGSSVEILAVGLRQQRARDAARRAAITFSGCPPPGSTCPVSVSSPVMASGRASFSLRTSTGSAVAMVTPALGAIFA